MIKADFPDRYYASVPADDPRFGELREVLAAVKQTGRHSRQRACSASGRCSAFS